jgi:prophage regulatory protein
MSKLIRIEEVQAKIGGICRTTIWKLEKNGLFPKRRMITPKAVGWDESEIDAWIQSRNKKAVSTPDIRRKPKGCPPK